MTTSKYNLRKQFTDRDNYDSKNDQKSEEWSSSQGSSRIDNNNNDDDDDTTTRNDDNHCNREYDSLIFPTLQKDYDDFLISSVPPKHRHESYSTKWYNSTSSMQNSNQHKRILITSDEKYGEGINVFTSLHHLKQKSMNVWRKIQSFLLPDSIIADNIGNRSQKGDHYTIDEMKDDRSHHDAYRIVEEGKQVNEVELTSSKNDQNGKGKVLLFQKEDGFSTSIQKRYESMSLTEENDNINDNKQSPYIHRLSARLKRDDEISSIRQQKMDQDFVNNEIVSHSLHRQHSFKVRTLRPTALSDGDGGQMSLLPTYEHQQFTYNQIIHIGEVKFEKHPLALKEEVLAHKLERIYEQYRSLKDQGVTEYLSKKLGFMVKTYIQFQNNSDPIDFEQVESFHGEMLSIVGELIEHEHIIYQLYSSILTVWKDIEEERILQRFSSTSINICKAPFDITEDSNTEKTEKIENEVNFRTIIHDLNSILKWFSDKSNLSGRGAILSDDTKLYLKKIDVIIQGVNTIEQMCNDRVDVKIVRDEESIYNNVHGDERKRRYSICSELYFVTLVINNQIINSTPRCKLIWPSYSIHFGNTIQYQYVNPPDNVFVQLWKHRRENNVLISSIFLPIPEKKLFQHESGLHMLTPDISWYHFTDTSPSKECRLSGNISLCVSWDQRMHKNIMSSKEIQIRCLSQKEETRNRPDVLIMSTDVINKQKNIKNKNDRTKKSSYMSATLNTQIMDFASNARNFIIGNLELNQSLRCFAFRLRAIKPYLYKTPIPLEDDALVSDMKEKVFYSYIGHKNDETILEEATNQRITVRKENILEFIKRLQEIQKQYDFVNSRKTVISEDILKEKIWRSEPQDMSWLWMLLSPPRRRSLHPYFFRPLKSIGHKEGKERLIVSILGANNVPMRIHSLGTTQTTESSRPVLQNFHTLLVSPFIQVKFRDKIYHSSTYTGMHLETWKQNVEIPLTFDGDESFSPITVKGIKESLEITLFDDVIIDIGKGGGYYDDEDTYLHEKRYLGHVTIPFSSVLKVGKVESHFYLSDPAIVGYGRSRKNGALHSNSIRQSDRRGSIADSIMDHLSVESFDASSIASEDDGYSSFCDNILRTSLKIMVTLDPMIHMSSTVSNDDSLPIDEESSLVNHFQDWMQENIAQCPFSSNRKILALIPGAGLSRVFITRFMKSLSPPEGFERSMKGCAHLVSLIPFLYNWKAFQDYLMVKSCSSSQQMLNISAGDWEEHAILLANFFLHIRENNPELFIRDVYLVQGFSMSEEEVVYVMTKHSDGNIIFWNPKTGDCFEALDERCPLMYVSCLISTEGIHYNIQNVTETCLTKFDMEDKKRWSFFKVPKNMSNISYLQVTSLRFNEVDSQLTIDLETKLLHELKTAIRSWRRLPTMFDYEMTEDLNIWIENLEAQKRDGKGTMSASAEYSDFRIESLWKGKFVYGVAMQFPMTNLDEIINEIEKIGVHQSKHPHVCFALSVRIFPYQGNLFSVWVFICSIFPDC